MENRFSFSYAVKPNRVNQAWGTLDPDTYSRFGFTRHNGVDVAWATDRLVRAPFDGTVVRVGNQPSGGGIYFGILSDGTFDFPMFTCSTPKKAANGMADGATVKFPAASCRVLADYLHLSSVKLKEGTHCKAGDVIAVQGNTGFSTGPHTHIQFRRVGLVPRGVSDDGRPLGGMDLVDVDSNAANDSFDPTAFWSGIYAADIAMVSVAAQAVEVAKNDTAPEDRTTIMKLLDAVKAMLVSLLFER